jgi:para-nitrobenzyl esterase
VRPGPACAQPGDEARPVVGSEDCLTLNVYAPPAARGPQWPVMVWIHGGANLWGRGADFDGSRLATRHGVVVVTVEYRLGPFGWFHHPAVTNAPGNDPPTGQFALLDLLAALHWVRGNVGRFGGDPGSVTLFGESAGGQNVYALVLAPAAAGLFHRAIAMSGGFWNMTREQAVHYADEPVPGTRASAREIVGELLVRGGEAAGPAEARRVEAGWTAERLRRWLLARSTAEVLAPYRGRDHVDYDVPSVVYDGALLPALDHRARLARGDYNAVPMIVGGSRDEQKLYLQSDRSLVREEAGRKVVIDPARYAAWSRFYSDWWNFMAVDDLLPRLSRPAWAYRFDWDDEPTTPSDLRTLWGAAHGLVVPFVSGDFDGGFAPLFTAANRTGRERLSAAMMSYWAAFARAGDPGRGTDGLLPEWRSWTASRSKLVLGADPPHMARLPLDGRRILDDLLASPLLTAAEKCAIYRDHVMYPSYPIAELAARGCPRP